jgi:hypothetical protein
MSRQALLALLNDMIERLALALPDVEVRHGWTDQSRTAMRTLFEQMRADLLQGNDLKSVPHYVALVRGLDHWGIGGGELYKAAALIGSIARAL